MRILYGTSIMPAPSLQLVLASAEPAAQPISVQTALLIILGIGLLFAVQSLAALHRRVDALGAPTKTRPPAPPRSAPEPIPPAIVAVITAAANEALGTDQRIVTITRADQDSSWSLEGRRQIFGSHKVR